MAGNELYLENVQEFLDDSKIVTYKTLSLTLSIPCNVAKQLLYQYWKKYANSDKELNITYLLSGVLKEDVEGGPSTVAVLLADESECKDMKERFAKVWTVHVYSLQRMTLKDRTLLYSSSQVSDHTKYAALSSIQCPSVVKATVDEKATPNESTDVVKKEEKTVSKAPPNLSFMKKTAEGSKVKPKQAIVNTMFGKVAKPDLKAKTLLKTEGASKSPTRSPVRTARATGSPVKRGRGRPKVKSSPQHKLSKFVENQSSDEGNEMGKAEPQEGMDNATDVMEEDKHHMKQQKSPLKKSRKRRRVKAYSSSSSEDNDVEKAEKNLLKSDVTKKEVSLKEATGQAKRRKRVKRLKTKMFEKEDGSLVTEKYYETESTDVSEDDPQVGLSPLDEARSVCDKKSPVRKKGIKQKSLTSFFGKK